MSFTTELQKCPIKGSKPSCFKREYFPQEFFSGSTVSLNTVKYDYLLIPGSADLYLRVRCWKLNKKKVQKLGRVCNPEPISKENSVISVAQPRMELFQPFDEKYLRWLFLSSLFIHTIFLTSGGEGDAEGQKESLYYASERLARQMCATLQCISQNSKLWASETFQRAS